MKFNKRAAASVLAAIVALGSTGLTVFADEENVSIENSLPSEESSDAAEINEVSTIIEVEDESGDYSLTMDEATGRITGYTDNVEPVYSNGVLQNPQDLDIPNMVNGIYVTGIEDEAFIGWERLGSINIETGIEYIGVSAFENCANVKSLFIPNSVTYIDEYAFYEDTSLETVTIEENSKLAIISYMSFAFSGIKEITIPESVTNIYEKAFRGCENLMKVYFEGDAPQNLAEDENAFSNCSSDLVLYFYEGKTGYTTPTWLYHKCVMISASNYSLTVDNATGRITGYTDNVEPVYSNGILQNPQDLVIPSVIDGVKVTGIEDEAFIGWERLGSITIESGVEYIGVSAFEKCVNVKSLFIPNSVTYIDEYAFYEDASLETVTIEENSKLAIISYMSFAFIGIKEITIPESVTNIYEKAFRGCENLMKVYFEGDAPQNLEEDENAFSYCNSDLVFYFYEGKTGYTTPTWLYHKCVMLSTSTEPKTWNFSDASLNSLGTITSDITVDGLTILANSDKYVQVKENKKTLNGVIYNFCLSLRGKGTSEYRAVKFNVSKDCTISVAAAASGSKSLKLVKEDGTVVASVPVGSELSVQNIEYKGKADSLYLYSDSDNINIYSLGINY